MITVRLADLRQIIDRLPKDCRALDTLRYRFLIPTYVQPGYVQPDSHTGEVHSFIFTKDPYDDDYIVSIE